MKRKKNQNLDVQMPVKPVRKNRPSREAKLFRNLPGSISSGLRSVFRSKYIELIFAVALFILLDTGVLIINFYTSYQIANDAHAIQLASKMGTLSQSLLHGLYRVEEDARNPDSDYIATIDSLADSYKVFDETLDAFIYGGQLIGVGQGQDSLLQDTTYRDTSANLLREAEEIWKVYRIKLKPIVYAYFNDAEREDVVEEAQAAISFAREQNDKLLTLVESFAQAVEGVALRKAERLRQIQSIGISLAVLNFFLILFHFLKRLRQSDALVEKSQKETKDILQNVNEGLFLLDKHYIIGSQHSDSLHSYFKQDRLPGQNFIDLLRPFVTAKTLETVEDYAEILFSARVNESLVADLNPLKQVEMNLTGDDSVFDVRYFSFQFSRVYEKRAFNALLVTVKDITEQVRLSEQLKAANDKASKEIATLLAIIHIENEMLAEFLQTTELGLNQVNDILKQPAEGSTSLKRKLEEIFRIIHKLKGDSTTLGLEFVVEKFHNLETEIIELRDQYSLTGEDFLPLVVVLNKLMSDFSLIRNLQQKMDEMQLTSIHQQLDGLTADNTLDVVQSGTSMLPSAAEDNSNESRPHHQRPHHQSLSDSEKWTGQMTTLVRQVAGDYGKMVELEMSGLDPQLLAESDREPVRDIIIQSLRNSIAHGIELPDLRQSLGKQRHGTVSVTLQRMDNGLQLIIRDDGQGIDLGRIREKAIENRLATAEQLDAWPRSRLLSLLFRQGFSTSSEHGLHAGHGVGMDLVKSRLNSLNGKVRIRFCPGQFTEFIYEFVKQAQDVQDRQPMLQSSPAASATAAAEAQEAEPSQAYQQGYHDRKPEREMEPA